MIDAKNPLLSPTPWQLHRTGSHIGIKDAKGKFVIRKVVNLMEIPDYAQLLVNFTAIVERVNAGGETMIETEVYITKDTPRSDELICYECWHLARAHNQEQCVIGGCSCRLVDLRTRRNHDHTRND